MNTILTFILLSTALFALYWVLIGQWKHNDMLRHQKRKIKAVLFDLDGVLIDSHDAWFKVFNHTRKKYKLNAFSKEEFDNNIWGGSVKYEKDAYFKKVSLEKLAKTYYINLLKNKNEIKVNPYAHYVLSNIKKKNLKLGLITNTYKKPALEILDYHGLRKFFDVIVAGDDIENGKPAPDAIFKACKKLKIKPSDALLVGDTKNDINAGKNAGCFTLGYKTDGDLKIDDLKVIVRML